MYNKTKFIISVLIVSLIIFSCGKTDKTDTSTKEKTTQDNKSGENSGTQQTDSQKKQSETKSTELKWDFRPLKPGQYDAPMTDVYLTVNGKSHFVTKIYYNFSETPKSEFGSFKVPADALASCRGWWAGAGIDYWVIQKDNELIVMGRDIGETTNDNGEPGDYEGKPVKVTTIKLD